MQVVACIFFRRVHVAGPLSGGALGTKNRPKTKRKTPCAGKGTCISVPILRCFASGQTHATENCTDWSRERGVASRKITDLISEISDLKSDIGKYIKVWISRDRFACRLCR